jgi:hypothetical protein
VRQFDAVLLRVTPGQLSPAEQLKFDALMRGCAEAGIAVFSSPDVQLAMGSKDAIASLAGLSCGMEDSVAYYDEHDVAYGFKRSIACGPRVLKQNRAMGGEGVWIARLVGQTYCARYGEAAAGDDWEVSLTEMSDGHTETHTVGQVLEFFSNGRCAAAGSWSTRSEGAYFDGGRAAGAFVLDMRFCPRAAEGEVRVLCAGAACLSIIHKSARGDSSSAYTFYSASEPRYERLVNQLAADLPGLMGALGHAGEPLPLLWTADFIAVDGAAPETTDYKLSELSCSCVPISKFQAAAYSDSGLFDVGPAEAAEATRIADACGLAVSSALLKRDLGPPPAPLPLETGPCVGLLRLPSRPRFRVCVVEYNQPGHPSGVGGADKGAHGHRLDSIPLCNGLIRTGAACLVVK